jgi:CDP-diacylglycerol--serine O-phosphatidyltransferase
MLNNYTVATDNWIAYLGFIITLGSCYRLANFNIDERQTDSFIGLPTPANALFILSLPLVLQHTNSEIVDLVLKNQLVLLSITALSTYILNAEIPLFSLKIKEFNLIKNKLQILFLTISVLLLVAFQFLGIPLVILFYLVLSVLKNREEKVINKE